MTRPDRAEWVSQHNLILLDGCDGAGKSALAEAVAARHGHAIVHAALTPEGEDLFSNTGLSSPALGRWCSTAASSANWSTGRWIAAAPG